MGFEQARFGGDTNVTTQVNNHYGPRASEGAVGKVKTEGVANQLSIEITGEDVGNASYKLLAPELPNGAIIEDVYLKVSEAFVLGGTTPAIEVGTEGSEETNGVTITEAQAEAAGSYDITSALAGTWASPLAADTTVGLALSGTTPTVTDAGKLEVVINYIVV